MKNVLNFFSLFSSFSTLICCALPALLVSLGLGGALAGLVSRFPAFIWISQYKGYLFIFSGLMISISYYLQWKNRRVVCEISDLKKTCESTRKGSFVLLNLSGIVYLLGFSFAYIVPLF